VTRRVCVLHLENNPFDIALCRDALADEGILCEVAAAETGKSCWRRCAEAPSS
jgi:hypothetical protein